jgi:peptidoglycan/LPS O-acetylase OafA/YrhL
MANSAHTIPFRRDIQGLRAVAIVLVVLAHAHVPGFAGGFVGVDVFFVLSGYLITGLLVRERLSTGGIRYSQFLSRRLRRLLPAMLAMLAVVLVLATLLLSAYETRMQTGSFVYAATWTSNFFFALSEFDYFSALQAKDLFLHTWSLGVEEQFYIVWPWLVVVAFAFLGSGGNAGNGKKPLLYLLATVFAVSLALCLHWAEYGPLLSFYMMPARGWQFAMGAAVFVWFHNFGETRTDVEGHSPWALLSSLIGVIGVLLIVGSAMLLDTDLAYPGLYALVPSSGAALVILAGRESASSVFNRVLASDYFVWVGDRSYSLYLWHWPVLLLGDAFGMTRGMVGTAALIAVSVLLASASYQLIERPFWKGRFSNASAHRTVFASAATVAIVVAAAYGLQANVYGAPQLIAGQDNYNPRLDRPFVYDSGMACDTWYINSELVPCSASDEDAKHTVVLLGDSIGAQWADLLTEVYSQPDWRVMVLTKSGCAIVDEEYYYAAAGGTYDVCSDWREKAIDYLVKTRPDIVFVGSSAHYEFTSTQWIDGVSRVLAPLSEAATQVVLIAGTPALSFNGPACLMSPYRFSFRLNDSRRECEEAMVSTVSDDVASYLEIAANRIDNVSVLNLNNIVCPGKRCAAQSMDGLTVFRDDKHLTVLFIRAQLANVLDHLQRLQVGPGYIKEAATVAATDGTAN